MMRRGFVPGRPFDGGVNLVCLLSPLRGATGVQAHYLVPIAVLELCKHI